MSIYKRGGVYWFSFIFLGQRMQRSTKQSDRRAARQIESAFRVSLAKGEAGIVREKPAPSFKEFAPKFEQAVRVRSAAKPATVAFYLEKLSRLREYEPINSARLDRIDEHLIENYVQHRRNQVQPGSVNRELATLRRMLRLAYEWKVINRVPRIRMLPGERTRDFVLSYAQEELYLDLAPEPLKDIALLILDTGMRLGEVLALEWPDVRLEPANGARFGYLRIKSGKSKNAQRNVSLTRRVSSMLSARAAQSESLIVFPSPAGASYQVTSIDHLHAKVRTKLHLPKDFVIHGLRHTMLSRLGESGAGAFEIMRIAGHSSVTVSQRYVHPSPEVLERAFERMERLHPRAEESLSEGRELQEATTVFTTLQN